MMALLFSSGVTMSKSYNLSSDTASAIVALLARNLVPFNTVIVDGPTPKRRVVVSVEDDYEAQLVDAVRLVQKAKESNIKVVPNTDSDEQLGSYMNGTLSNVAPGLALTVQVSPSFTREAMTESEAEALFPSMFLPLSAMGWDVFLIMGNDTENPIEA